MSECRNCGQEIKWMKTENNKNIRVDPDTVADEGAEIFDPETMTAHFVTCPDSEKRGKP